MALSPLRMYMQLLAAVPGEKSALCDAALIFIYGYVTNEANQALLTCSNGLSITPKLELIYVTLHIQKPNDWITY